MIVTYIYSEKLYLKTEKFEDNFLSTKNVNFTNIFLYNKSTKINGVRHKS